MHALQEVQVSGIFQEKWRESKRKGENIFPRTDAGTSCP